MSFIHSTPRMGKYIQTLWNKLHKAKKQTGFQLSDFGQGFCRWLPRGSTPRWAPYFKLTISNIRVSLALSKKEAVSEN